jgi:dipeptidyl aminopeptidase/acylaminoacyl peptidase
MLAAAERNYMVESAESRRMGVEPPPWEDVRRAALTREQFSTAFTYEGFECLRMRYLSDGLQVTGYIWKPKDTQGKKLPLIIYNRGGNQEFGRLSPWMQNGFYTFLEAGFVVVASQYRGNDGGQGKEQFGGEDVNDVLNLVPLARRLGYIDMENVFLYGVSRGGMMSYLAIKQGIPVKAAAVVSGLADLPASLQERPEFTSLYRDLIPDFASRHDEVLSARSAVAWPERLNSPILILHGTADWRSHVDGQARALSQKLKASGKSHELVVYEGDMHGLPVNSADTQARILVWFRQHLK